MNKRKFYKSVLFSEEMFFMLYFWGFVFLRPILLSSPRYSTLILAMYSCILVSLSLIKMVRNKINLNSYYLIFSIVFIILLDSLLRNNSYTFKYLYEFIIYGAVPIHLISQVKGVKRVIKLYVFFSFVMYMFFFLDPIFGYRYFGDYMTFGFLFALPVYIGIHIGRTFLNHKWLIIFEICCLIEILVFSNRSALLSVVLFVLLIEIATNGKKIKSYLKYLLVSPFILILIFNVESALSWMLKVLDKYGVYSYSIIHVRAFILNQDSQKLFSGRLEIWKQANKMISEKFVCGSGTGYFESVHNFYTHNLYLDVMVQYGLIGVILFSILIVVAIYRIFSQDMYVKIFGIMLFCLWFPKLFLSVYFYRDIAFWCFLVLGSNKNLINESEQIQ